MKLSKILYMPLVAGTTIFLILSVASDGAYAMWLVPFVVGIAVLYILQPQIDWWWFQRRPPQLEPALGRLLEKLHPFFRQLDPMEKRRFGTRLALYLFAVEFIPKGFEDVPEDVKLMTGSNIIQMTFGRPDYRMEKFERVVMYPVPFPSPQFPKHRHASEIFEEDGVILFSAEQVMSATVNPKKYYNLALYEFARVFRLSNPYLEYPSLDESNFADFKIISGFSRELILATIGLPEADPLAVGTSFFFTHPQPFKKQLPEVYEMLSRTYNMDPLNAARPVRDIQLLRS